MKTFYKSLLLSTLPFLTYAQEITLDPVTITSSVVAQRISESGRNISVLKSDDLKQLPIQSLDDALRHVAGVEVQSRGPLGSQSDFSIRGGTFQQVLVIVDGMRINDPTTGHFSSYIPVPIAEIERIEILKGASSAVYGSDAVGGVINVVTKSFMQQNQALLPRLQARLLAGDKGLWGASTHFNQSFGKLKLSASYNTTHTDGQSQRGTRGAVHNHLASISGNYQVSKYLQIMARTTYDTRHFGAQNFYTAFVSDTATEQLSSSWNQIQATYKKERSTLQISGAYKATSDYYQYNTVTTANENKSRLGQLLLTWDEQLSTTAQLVTGINVQQRAIRSNDRGNHEYKQFAPFVVLRKQYKNWHFHPALRFDWRYGVGTEWVPQLSVAHRFNELHLRGSIGKTIRDADFTERYNNYNKALVTGGNLGNPNLKPEKAVSYEIGTDWFLLPLLKISATYFKRDQHNIIDYTPTPFNELPRVVNLIPTGSYALAQNITSVNVQGVELETNYRKIWDPSKSLTLNAGATWLSSSSNQTTPSFYISSHAKFIGNGNATFQWGKWLGSITAIYKERKSQQQNESIAKVSPHYFVCNFKIGYNISKQIAAHIQADNLLNTTYADLLGAQMPGRWLSGGLRLELY